MGKCFKQFFNGLIKENPTFVLMLGMCPTLAVTTSASNGIGMGLTTTAVLVMSNLFISLLRKIIPDKVRIPAFIVVVATFVTIVQMLLQAYLPDLNKSLGLYIPLIVVNCIILGRAEAFAYKNGPIVSLFDGLGMGLGFTLGLTCIATVRELLGNGTVFSYQVMPDAYEPMSIFILAPGAFFVLAALTALQNVFRVKSATNVKGIQLACTGNCAKCADGVCVENRSRISEAKEKEEAVAQAEKAAKAKEAAEKKAQADAEKAKAEAEKAKAEAEKEKEEAGKAKAEAEMEKPGIEKAKAEAEKSEAAAAMKQETEPQLEQAQGEGGKAE